jgi:putative tryptophan/tyrosine transport system substrate-binding protein
MQFDRLKRREFITLLAGAAAWPLAARAQQTGKVPTIGFLGANPSIDSNRIAAFVQRLRELAWIDGRNLAIEYRWAEGRNERNAENAAELVPLKVDVIVTEEYDSKEALWDKFYTAAPPRRRQSVEQYKIVKRA